MRRLWGNMRHRLLLRERIARAHAYYLMLQNYLVLQNLVGRRIIWRIRIPVTLLVLVLIFFFWWLFTPFTALGQSSITTVFILGDSSVNCGDNAFFYPFVHGGNSTFSICNSTDRRFIPDLLVEKMGLPAVPPFYGQNGSIEGIVYGLNYGSSSATILNSGELRFQGLNQQLRQAFETLQLLELELGPNKAREVVSGSIFYISFGTDDYVQLFLNAFSGVRKGYGRQEFALLLVDQMTRVVENLYSANVRRIVCMGIGPLGCAPRVLWESYNSTSSETAADCVDSINKLVSDYNSMLSSNIIGLNSKLPGASIVFCDIYKGMMKIIKDPKSYGFENVNDACCGLGRFEGMVGCVSKEMACTNRSTHVWWDLYSPTDAVNTLLADWAWSGLPVSICDPINIQQLASTSPFDQVATPPRKQ